MDKYTVVKQVGSGSYGDVFLVRNHVDKKQYVMKKIFIKDKQGEKAKDTISEVKLLSELRHPNIVEFYESFQVDNQHICIIMAYCEGGDLFSLLKARNKEFLDEKQILDWFIQIALALLYMHEQKVIHRDLKTQNIFLTKRNIIKIGDFGISRVLSDSMDLAKTMIGTPYYMSPEVFENKAYDYKSDVWSLGCCLYEMIMLKHAFDAKEMPALIFQVLKGNPVPIAPQYSDNIRSLVAMLLEKNPALRPSIADIFQMPFIRQYMEYTYQSFKQQQQQQQPTPSTPPISKYTFRSFNNNNHVNNQINNDQQHQQQQQNNQPSSSSSSNGIGGLLFGGRKRNSLKLSSSKVATSLDNNQNQNQNDSSSSTNQNNSSASTTISPPSTPSKKIDRRRLANQLEQEERNMKNISDLIYNVDDNHQQQHLINNNHITNNNINNISNGNAPCKYTRESSFRDWLPRPKTANPQNDPQLLEREREKEREKEKERELYHQPQQHQHQQQPISSISNLSILESQNRQRRGSLGNIEQLALMQQSRERRGSAKDQQAIKDHLNLLNRPQSSPKEHLNLSNGSVNTTSSSSSSSTNQHSSGQGGEGMRMWDRRFIRSPIQDHHNQQQQQQLNQQFDQLDISNNNINNNTNSLDAIISPPIIFDLPVRPKTSSSSSSSSSSTSNYQYNPSLSLLSSSSNSIGQGSSSAPTFSSLYLLSSQSPSSSSSYLQLDSIIDTDNSISHIDINQNQSNNNHHQSQISVSTPPTSSSSSSSTYHQNHIQSSQNNNLKLSVSSPQLPCYERNHELAMELRSEGKQLVREFRESTKRLELIASSLNELDQEERNERDFQAVVELYSNCINPNNINQTNNINNNNQRH